MKTKSPCSGPSALRGARNLVRATFIGSFLATLISTAHAASGYWSVDVSGNWSTVSNWQDGVIAGGFAGDTANLMLNISTARTITVDGSNKILGVLNIGDTNNSHAYTVAGSTALYFNNGAADAQITQVGTSKGDTINASIGIIGNGALSIANASANTLTIGSYTQAGSSGSMTLTLDTSSGPIEYKGPITNGGSGGSIAVVKNGSGTLKLTGTAGNSSFSGGLTLNAGTLEFGYSQTALGTGTFTLNGGVLTNGYGASRTLTTNNPQVWNANLSFGNAGVGGQDLNLGAGAVTLSGNRTVTVSSTNATRTLTVGGDISGTGFGLIKAGNATLALNGTNTYTGPTTVSAGTLRLGRRTALNNGTTASWTAASFVVNSGTTAALSVGGANGFTSADLDVLTSLGSSSGGFKSGSILELDTTGADGGIFAYGGDIANPNGGANVLSLVKSGANTLALSGASTYTGTTTLNAGTLAIESTSAIGSGSLVINGGALANTSGSSVTLTTDNAQYWNSDYSFFGPDSLNLGTGAVTTNASRTISVDAATLTVGGVIGGDGLSLTKTGAGTLKLTGANTYTGDTLVREGTLTPSGQNSIRGNLIVGVPGGTTTASVSLASANITGPNVAGGATQSEATVYPDSTLGVAYNGSSYLKALTVTGGTVNLGGSAYLGVYSRSGTSSGTITMTGGLITGNPMNGTLSNVTTLADASTAIIACDLNTGIYGTFIYNVADGAATIDLNVTGKINNGSYGGTTSGINKSGAGLMQASAANVYTGPTAVTGGTLKAGVVSVAGVSGAFGKNSAVTLSDTAGVTLDITGYNTQIGSLAGGGSLGGIVTLGSAVLTTGANNTSTTFSGVISGSGSVVKTGTGTWTLNGANTYTGGTVINDGTIVIGTNGAIGPGPLTISGGNLVMGGSATPATSGTLTFNPAMGAGSISLDFTGAQSVANVTDGSVHAIAGTYTAAQLNTFFGTSVFTGTGSLTVGSWVSVPLGGGGFVSGLVSDSSGTDIYCRTDVGGAFRWVPAADGINGSWLSVTDTLVSPSLHGSEDAMSISSIAVDPTNADNLYVAAGFSYQPYGSPNYPYRGIYASTDRGGSWTKINQDTPIVMDGNGTYRGVGERLAADPNNPAILWFGSIQQGLYKGVKSGATWTWTQIPAASVPFGAMADPDSDKAGVTFVACDPNGGATIVYAGVFDNTATSIGGVYRSEDGGSSWLKVSGVDVKTPARGQVAPDGSLYVTSGNVVARLPRGGSLAAITPSSAYSYRGIAVDPTDSSGNKVYVAEHSANENSRIWRSTNGGLDWTIQYLNFNDNRTIGRSEPDGTKTLTGYWFGKTAALWINPSNPNELWATDYFGVARTRNAQLLGGTTIGSQAVWHMLQVNQEEVCVETIKNAPTGPQLMVGVADVGGFRYNDIFQRPYGAAGSGFSNPAQKNTTSLDYHEPNPNIWVRAWAGGMATPAGNRQFYGTGAYSLDAGLNWTAFGEIDRHVITSGSAGWETWDLTTYLAAQKAKDPNMVVTLVVAADTGRHPTYGAGVYTQSFASKENATVANRPQLLINSTTPLLPTADATADGANPSTPNGSATTLGLCSSFGYDAYEKQIYLKFDLSGVPAITSASLRLYRQSGGTWGANIPAGVYACSNVSWTEAALIYTGRPTPYASSSGKPASEPRYKTSAGVGLNGGRVAISATNPDVLVWMPTGSATVPHYSHDRGVTWEACIGLPAGVNKMLGQSFPSYLLQQLAADRVNGDFYIEHLYGSTSDYKKIYKSTDDGVTWTYACTIPYGSNTNNNVYRCQIVAAPAAGHVWMSDDGISNPAKGGLWKTLNGASSAVQVPDISGVRVVSFGKPPAGSPYLYSTYFMGYYNGVKGVYRSDDYGSTWTALPGLPSDVSIESIAGDLQVHGSVFIGTGGRGVFQTQ